MTTGRKILVSSLEHFKHSLESIDQNENYAIPFVERMLSGALDLRASDVHLECRPEALTIKIRLDGVLFPIASAPIQFSSNILARLKYLAKMPVYQHQSPQDGRLTFISCNTEDEIDLRISFLPTVYGEKAVIRLPEPDRVELSLDNLGLPTSTKDTLTAIVQRRQGLLLLTGPSSSGKTTSTYSLLRYIYEECGESINIATIEDPVEQRLGFLSQIQVNEAFDLTFDEGLKSILRQDPDIIAVGEIRDAETAATAVQAALTGHLVVSTVHSTTAVGVFLRLLHMGLEPYLVASAIQGVLAQRLVRRLCASCRVEDRAAALEPALRERLDLNDDEIIYRPIGCNQCRSTGYIGRTGVFEMIAITPALQELIIEQAPVARFHKWAAESNHSTILNDGLAKVRSGITSPEEILRVSGLG